MSSVSARTQPVIFSLLPLCLLLLLRQEVVCYTVDDSYRLLQNITSNYSREIRPVYNQSKLLSVYISLEIVSIHEFDEVAEKVTGTAIVFLEWTDELIQWDPDDYDGIESLLVKRGRIWTLELLHVNPAKSVEKLTEDWHVLRVNASGRVQYNFGAVFTSSCSVDVTYYPMDRQNCDIQLSFIGYNPSEVVFIPAYEKVLTNYYTGNGAWDLSDSSVSVRFFGSLATFNLVLDRKAQFVIVNIICPIVLLSILNILIFFIPTESGERISYAITVLLAIAVFLTVVGDNLPKTSSPMSLYSYYLMSILFISTCITMVTIVTVRLYHKDDKDSVGVIWRHLAVLVTKNRKCYTVSAITDKQPTELVEGGVQKQYDMSSPRQTTARTEEDTGVYTNCQKNDKNHRHIRNCTVEEKLTGDLHAEKQQKMNDKITWQTVSTALDNIFFVFFAVVLVVDTAVFTVLISCGK